MRHAIFGAGNLGLDLQHELRRQHRVDASIFSMLNGFDVRDLAAVTRVLERGRFDVVWWCVGAGVQDHHRWARLEEEESRLTLATIPACVAEVAPPETALVFFSSADAADESFPTAYHKVNQTPRSELAQIRVDFERWMFRAARARTAIVRLGDLYGLHKPDLTFPGAVLRAYGFGPRSGGTIKLPQNLTTPTPSLWAAERLVRYLGRLLDDHGPRTHHLAPRGAVSYLDWAKFVLAGLRGDDGFSRAEFYDDERPTHAMLDCSFTTENWGWHEVWRTYFDQRRFTPIESRSLLPFDIAALRESAAPA